MRFIDWERTPAVEITSCSGFVFSESTQSWEPRNPGVWLEGGCEVSRETFEAMFPGLPPLPETSKDDADEFSELLRRRAIEMGIALAEEDALLGLKRRYEKLKAQGKIDQPK